MLLLVSEWVLIGMCVVCVCVWMVYCVDAVYSHVKYNTTQEGETMPAGQTYIILLVYAK